MNPEIPGDDERESMSLRMLPTEKATRDERVRRVYDRDEMEAFCGRWFQKEVAVKHDDDTEHNRYIAERIYKQAIDHIRQDMRERIYWGLYNDWNELKRLTEIREIERLTGDDAYMYQKLLLKGLKEDPPAFGAQYKEEIIKLEKDGKKLTEKGLEQVTKFIEERYVVGVKHSYINAEGETNERIVGFGRLERKAGAESHKGYAGGLYVHKAHQGRGISRSIILHLFDKAESLGLKHVDAVVVASNKWLRQYYARIGFRDMRTEYDAVEIDGTSYDWVHIRLDMDTYRQNRPKL